MRVATKITGLTSLALLAFVMGCDRDDSFPDPPAQRSTSQAAGANTNVANTEAEATRTKEEFLGQLDRRLRELDTKMDEFSRKSASWTAEARLRAEQAAASLREQRTNVGTRAEELKRAGAESWREVKTGLDAAVVELERAFDNAKAKFRENSPQP